MSQQVVQVAGDPQPLLRGGQPGDLALRLSELDDEDAGVADAHEQHAERDDLQHERPHRAVVGTDDLALHDDEPGHGRDPQQGASGRQAHREDDHHVDRQGQPGRAPEDQREDDRHHRRDAEHGKHPPGLMVEIARSQHDRQVDGHEDRERAHPPDRPRAAHRAVGHLGHRVEEVDQTERHAHQSPQAGGTLVDPAEGEHVGQPAHPLSLRTMVESGAHFPAVPARRAPFLSGALSCQARAVALLRSSARRGAASIRRAPWHCFSGAHRGTAFRRAPWHDGRRISPAPPRPPPRRGCRPRRPRAGPRPPRSAIRCSRSRTTGSRGRCSS